MPFIRPLPLPSPEEDDALEDLLGETVAGVTGIDRNLVRPRWQPEPSNVPDFDVDWCAIGATVFPADAYVFKRQIDDTTVAIECSEELQVLASFYGPNAMRSAAEFRDGLQVDENRAVLAARKIKLVRTGEQRQVPSLQKQIWTKRVDVPVRLRRWVERRYAVASIGSLASYLDNEFYLTPITVSPPP